MKLKSTFKDIGNWYKGNIHAHTNISDGIMSPSALVAHYEGIGYDFLSITDHRVYGVHDLLNKADFIVLPGVELDIKPDEDEAICHHVVGLGIPGKNNFSQGQRIEYSQDMSLQDMVDFLNVNGNLPIYAHPHAIKVRQEKLAAVSGLIGLEIYNHTCEVAVACGGSESWYDRLLWEGKRVWCIACDDTHQLEGRADIAGGYIKIKAEELSQEALFDSIQAGSFYASQGPEINLFQTDGKTVYLTCSPCRQIDFLTDISWYSGLSIRSNNADLSEASFDLKGAEKYVRVVVHDEQCRKAWSQPIWLS